MIFRRLLTKDHSALLCKLYFKKKARSGGYTDDDNDNDTK